MKPSSIFLIRHGESIGNIDNTVYSHTPDWKIPLTDVGLEQATEAGKKLALLIHQRYGRDKFIFYTSPWYRARQTTQCIRTALENIYSNSSAEVKEDPRIREQEWGNYQEYHVIQEVKKDRKKYGTFFYRFHEGESGADVFDRVATFIGTMHRDFEKNDFPSNVIIVSHGLAIKAFLMKWFKWSVEDFDNYDTPDNCSIIQMDLQENDKYKLMTELKLYT